MSEGFLAFGMRGCVTVRLSPLRDPSYDMKDPLPRSPDDCQRIVTVGCGGRTDM